MDSIVDAMAAAYDALVDAFATAVSSDEPGRAAAVENLKHCLDVFRESCDRAEDLVQAAAANFGPAPPAASRLDALSRTAQAIEQDLQAAGEEKAIEMEVEEVEMETEDEKEKDMDMEQEKEKDMEQGKEKEMAMNTEMEKDPQSPLTAEDK